MKKILIIILILVIEIINVKGQCICNYIYNGTTDVVTFTNLSTISNAHYYWDFGDGSTSYFTNPTHTFPESGKFLVTLFGKDTISNCHTYYETWITVNKPTTDNCNTYITDTIINNSIAIYDLSTNCGGYSSNYDSGPAQNFPPNNWIGVEGWSKALFISRVQYYTNDSINGFVLRREYYKTRPYNYSSSPNYDACSANFEYYLDYQQNGARLHFIAMNQNAASYNFVITGLGNPINLNSPNASYLMPYVSYEKYFPWLIGSYITDSNGCKDSVWKQIFILNPNYIVPPNCAIAAQPQNQIVYVGTNAHFIISTSQLVSKQWQQDAGLGYVNLTNAGPYSGVQTDTLTISNIQLAMNNYHYRCLVSEDFSNCHNTSSVAILSILLDVNDIEFNNLKVFPNPFTDYLFIEGDSNYRIQIINVIGQIIYEDVNVSKINLTKISHGIYYLLLYNKSGQLGRIEKIIKE